MKILDRPVGAMYIWAAAFLSALAIISSYTLEIVPYTLIFAVVLAAAIDILINRLYLKHSFGIPFSGIITGLIIGSVAPSTAPLLLIVVAVMISICSKFFLRFRGSNIFNPAALGLLISLFIFRLGSEWWAAANYNIYGIAFSLTPILIILAYLAKRLPAALCFTAALIALNLIFSSSHLPNLALLLSINYYFAFVMLVEPKTSPYKISMQIVYGLFIAVLYFMLSYARIQNPVLIALLAGNAIYAVYRYLGGR